MLKKKINVITSNYHIDRSQRIFDFVFYQNDILMHAAKNRIAAKKMIFMNINHWRPLKKLSKDNINPGDIDWHMEEIYYLTKQDF